jgi:hypothetical protein
VNNLKQIGLALRNYHDAYGCFPPAYLADTHGRPMHSWRVLILPWLEQKAIYDRYRFDEPWNGPNNRKLHALVIPSYTCRTHPRPGHSTAYAAIVGPKAAWYGAKPMRLGDVQDDPNQTIHVIEVSAPAIHWMEPRDIPFDRMSFAIGGPDTRVRPSSHHPGGANILMMSGAARWLSAKIAPEHLRALLTIAGRDDVGEF